MPLVIEDRVRETTTVTGTNDATLLGAVTGFQAFSVIGNGNTTYYTISDQSGGNWEVGLGTYSSVGPTLARTTVLSSSAGGSKVSFPAGTKDVFVTYPSEKAVYLDGSNNAQPALGNVVASQVNITAQGDLRLEDTSGGQYVAIHAPSTVATSYTLTLPVDDGTNGQALITDGNGVLSWSSAASGDVYGPASATDNAISRFDGTTGKIIQNSSALIDDVGNVLAGAGLVGAPAFSTTGDTNTGIFFPAADTIAFTEGGVESMRITSDGRLGIGTASPTVPLDVAGNARLTGTNLSIVPSTTTNAAYVLNTNSGGNFFFAIDNSTGASFGAGAYARVLYSSAAYPMVFFTNDAERMRITSAGNVGIGTSSPLGRLALGALVSNQVLSMYDDATNWYGFGISSNNFQMSAATGAAITFNNITRSGGGSLTERMRIDSSGNVGIGTSSPSYRLSLAGANVGASLAETGSTYSMVFRGNSGAPNIYDLKEPTANRVAISFDTSAQTISALTAGTSRLLINSSGNVGIATTTPQSRLTVMGTTTPASDATGEATGVGTIRISNGSVTLASEGGLEFKIAGDSNGYGSKIQALNSAGSQLVFASRNATATWSEQMRITSTGNVGIGTSSPIARLNVSNGSSNLPLIVQGGNAGVGNDGGGIAFSTSIASAITSASQAASAIRSLNSYGSESNGEEGSLAFYTNLRTGANTYTGLLERMRIDSVGRVGIGTNSPGYRLDVVAPTGNGNTVARFYQSVSGGNTDVYFNNVDNVGDWLVTRRSNGEGWLYMSGSNPIVFFTNATERMRVNAGAPILCLAGGNTSATGTGIAFPATQSASADVNTLDDYEEGTWTPRLEFDGINATSYTTLYGMYTKIGRQVTVSGRLVVNVLGSVGSGLARIYGLPFAAGNFGPSPTFSGSMVAVTTLVAVTGTLGLWIDNNGGISIIPYSNENGSGNFTFGTNYTSGSGYTFTMTYFV
jgi:hypothetical protein